MAYQITSESYGRRLPKITATADSTDDLATLGTDWAEGSTCVIGSTTYSLDKVQGWVEPGSGGGGGSLTVVFSTTDMENFTADKTCAEVMSAYNSLVPVYGYVELPDGGYVTIAVKNVYAEYIVFGKTTIVTGNNELAEMTLVLNNDESVTYRDDAYTLTPIT